MSDPIPFRLLDERVVARAFGVPVKTLQAWRLRGEGPPFAKLGRSVRYAETDIAEWIKTRTVTSTSAASAAEVA